MKKMNLKQNRKGFTMAELLIVVAILVVLAGVSFIAVQNHQKSMTQLEYDAIAKEIFIASQNHLTMAESQGYSELISDPNAAIDNALFGNVANSSIDPSTNSTKPDIFYIQVTNGNVNPSSAERMLRLMLPEEAIDPTIYSGDFIIRYQRSSATILDVFYSNPNLTAMLTAKGVLLTGQYDYNNLMANYRGDDKASERRSVPLGWFGDADANVLPVGAQLNAPQIEVHNEEKLWILVKDKNAGITGNECSTVLKVTGETSSAKIVFWLTDENNPSLSLAGRIDGTNRISGEYKVVLDDITTSKMHFASMNDSSSVPSAAGLFVPGENIAVEAISFSNTKLTNIAYSGKKVTNSLFESVLPREMGGTVYNTAMITNFRHLENLDSAISNFDYAACLPSGTLTHVEQTDDLIWVKTGASSDGFLDIICNSNLMPLVPSGADPNNANIYKYDIASGGGNGLYLPININSFALEYQGNGHSISYVKADDSTDAAGLFGSLQNRGSTQGKISNLILTDFTISGSDAGALIGSGMNYEVTNVLAKGSGTITASTGDAGGLIGKLDGGNVNYCAASLIVSGSGSAGGLIGTASGTSSVSGCYSGGHTKEGAYEKWITAHSDSDAGVSGYDVTGTTAGGLIGNAGSTGISNSYSTCSVNGSGVAGGFAGSANGSITNCYSTGIVVGETQYAFLGSGSYTGLSGCHYYEIINENLNDDETKYMLPHADYAVETMQAKIVAIDHETSTYNNFVDAQGTWTDADPYDPKLATYYKDSSDQALYNLKGISRLDTLTPANYFVNTHYGDWPAPEVFIINN